MALPELNQRLVDKSLAAYCEQKIPTHARNQVRLAYTFWSNSVTLNEEREVHDTPGKWTKMPIAQFRFDTLDKCWRLYCAHPKRRDGWLLYPDAEHTKDFDVLLAALDRDKSGAFWG
jgi:hypothetical protein